MFILKIERNIRYALLNINAGVYVSKQAFIARSAKLQLKPGGCAYGGQIYISANASIMDGVILAPYGGSIYIGENVFIGPYCVIYGHGGLKIEKKTMIAAHSVVIPSNHGFSDKEKPISSQPATSIGINIGEDVWIGCGVRVLDGISIGKGCVIGAGAVVNKSLPDYSIAVGLPATVIGKRGDLHRFTQNTKYSVSSGESIDTNTSDSHN